MSSEFSTRPLVERLRFCDDELMNEAADEIEFLRDISDDKANRFLTAWYPDAWPARFGDHSFVVSEIKKALKATFNR